MKKTLLITILPAIVLAALKLTGVISLSWWWVTSPVWIPAAWSVVVAISFCVFVKKYIDK